MHPLPPALTGGGFVVWQCPPVCRLPGARPYEKRNTTLTYKVLPKRHKYRALYEKNFAIKKLFLKFDNSYIKMKK